MLDTQATLESTAEQTQTNALSTTHLNPQQLQAVEATPRAAVQVLAGAGTGKTELIAHRFIRLVQAARQNGITEAASRILVVTFTEKAALAMRERISQRLQDAGLEALPEEAWIHTFHGFCARLQEASLSALPSNTTGNANTPTLLQSLPLKRFQQRLLDELKADKWHDISQVLARHQLSEISRDCLTLKALQRLPVDSISSFLARLPRVVERIKSSGLTPAELYATGKRMNEALRQGILDIPVTYAFGEPLADNLREYAELWHQHLAPWAADSWNPLAVVEGILEPRDTHYKEGIAFLMEDGLTLAYGGRKLGYVPVTPRETDAFEAVAQADMHLLETICAFYALYQQQLQAQQAYDFDDLIQQAVALLEERPEQQAHYQSYFYGIIVDEFQDSNPAQLKLLQLLRNPARPALTVVGDLKQSIYGFRHAQPENLSLVFENTPYESLTLGTNYRSTPAILQVANAVARNIIGNDSQALTPPAEVLALNVENASQNCPETDTCTTLEEAPESGAPVSWRVFGVPTTVEKKDGSLSEKPEAIDAIRARELEWICQQVETLTNRDSWEYQDIAILVKRHTKAQELEARLISAGVPAIRPKATGFLDEPLVKTLYAALSLLSDPNDEQAAYRLLGQKLNARQLLAVKQASKQRTRKHHETQGTPAGSILEALANPGSQNTPDSSPDSSIASVMPAVQELAQSLLALHRGAATLEPAHMLDILAEQLGLNIIENTEESPDEAPKSFAQKRQQDLIRSFRELVQALTTQIPREVEPPERLSTVVELLAQYREDASLALPVEPSVSTQNAVQILTVHAAKGLEFPVVFVAYADSDRGSRSAQDSMVLVDSQYEGKAGYGVFWGKANGLETVKKKIYRNIWEKPRLDSEEQRLFYVALTRARKQLYVSCAQQSARWSQPPAALIHSNVLNVWHEAREPDRG